MASTSHSTVELTLLGSFALLADGVVLQLPQPAQRLLAHLAVQHRHRPVRRATLAEKMWPDASPAQAASNLRSVLWRLPRPRGRQLVLARSTDLSLSSTVHVDLWHATEVADALCAAQEPVAPPAPDELASLDQDLLPDWHDEWLEVERESHRQHRLHALERCSACLREQGHYVEALRAGLTAVRSEPLRESAHRHVIEVHLAEGNHAEALRQYQGYRRLLAAELGLSPSPAMGRLVAPLLGRPAERRRREQRRTAPGTDPHNGSGTPPRAAR